MADVQDVLNTMVAQIAGWVYPNGTAQKPVYGSGVRVFSGWPLPAQLDADLPKDIAHVSVYTIPGVGRNTTRYAPSAHVGQIVAATLTLTAVGNVLTVGGAMPSPFALHNMAVLMGKTPYIYSVQPTDTPASIATALATLLAVDYPGTTSSGSTITVAGTAPTAVRVGTSAPVSREWERESRRFQVSVWAPDEATRSVISAAIRSALSKISFLVMPDGFGAHVVYAGDQLSDSGQKVRIYRRDIFYEIEYATTDQETAVVIVAALLNQQPLQ